MDLHSVLPVLSMLSFVRAQTTNSMSMDWGLTGPDTFGPITTPSLMPDVGTMGGGVDPSMASDNGAQGGTGGQANQGNSGLVDWFSLGVEPPQFTYNSQASQTKRPSTSTAFPPVSTTFKSNFLPLNTNPQYSAQNPQYNTQSFSAKRPSFSSKSNSKIEVFEKPVQMSFTRQKSRLKPAAVVSDSHKQSGAQLQAVKQTMTVSKQEQNGNSWSAFSPNSNPSRRMNPQINNRVGSKSGWTEQTNNKWGEQQQQPVQKNSWSIRPQSANSNTNNGGSTGGWQAIPNQDRLKESNPKEQQPKYQAQTFKDLRIPAQKNSNNEFKINQNKPGRPGDTNQVRTSNGQMRNQRQDNGFRNRDNNNQNERRALSNQSKGRQRVVMVATRSNTQPRFQEQSASNSGPEQRGRSRDRSASGPPVHFTSTMKRQNEESSPPRRSVSKSDWSIIAPAQSQEKQQSYTNGYQPEPPMPRKERQVNRQNWQTLPETPNQQQLLDKPPERSPVLSQPVHRQRISNRAETNSQREPQRPSFQMPSPPPRSFREQNQPSDQFQQNAYPADNQYQQQQQQQMSGQDWNPQIQQASQSLSAQNEIITNIRTLLNQQQQLQKQQVQWQQKQLEIQKQQQMLQRKNVQAMNKFSNTVSGLMSTFTNMQTGIDKMHTMIGKFLAAV